jgi:hypothetical protein
MFELHVVVASVVMFNILELIMEIVPNYPTEGPWYCYLWKYVADENMPKIDITMNTDIVPLKMVVSGQVVRNSRRRGGEHTGRPIHFSLWSIYSA